MVSICIRGGWLMGNVKDRYFKYAENGDQFVGRCLALLPLQHVDLATSPPFFSNTADTTWISSMVHLQFSAVSMIPEFGLFLRMCLCSIIYHREWIEDFLSFNHVVKTSSVCLRSQEELDRVKTENWIKVVYPWQDRELTFSGIPPFSTILQPIYEVRTEQRSLCMSFVDKVKESLTDYGVNAGTLSEERVNGIMNEFYLKFEDQLNR
jgi:hypothetical protein